MKEKSIEINPDNKTCDQCEHGNPIGEGDLWCSLYNIIREDYTWSACKSGFKEW